MTETPNKNALTKYVAVFKQTVVAVRGTRDSALNAGLSEAGIARSQIEQTFHEFRSIKRYTWTEVANGELIDCGFRVGKVADFRHSDYDRIDLKVYDGLEYDEEVEEVELRNTTVELDEMLDVAAMLEEVVRAEPEPDDVQSWRVRSNLSAFNLLEAPCQSCAEVGNAVQLRTEWRGQSECICMDCLEAAAEELRELAYERPAEVLGQAL